LLLVAWRLPWDWDPPTLDDACDLSLDIDLCLGLWRGSEGHSELLLCTSASRIVSRNCLRADFDVERGVLGCWLDDLGLDWSAAVEVFGLAWSVVLGNFDWSIAEEDFGLDCSFADDIFGRGSGFEVIPVIISSTSAALACIMLLRQAVSGVSGAAMSRDFLDLSEFLERIVPALELSL